MTKITADHLARSAYVYIRQSTPDQLANNPESRRRQYALKTRARALGWENVVVIDNDLGRSAAGRRDRVSNACWRRSAACASSSCGWARRGSTCRPLSMVPRVGRCGGGRRATTPSIGC